MHLLNIILLSIYLSACTQSTTYPDNRAKTCIFPNKQIAPGWICGEPIAGLAIQAIGVADKSVAGANYMRDMARVDAIKNLSESFQHYTSKAVIQYFTSIQVQNEDVIKLGASCIKAINIELFDIAQQYRYEIGPEGRAYILVGLDYSARDTLLEQVLTTSMEIEPALWKKFEKHKSLTDMVSGIIAMQDSHRKL